MELKQQAEPRKAPYPLVLVSVISGAFFLVGVGISGYTLNTIEAAQSSSNNLNIAKLAQSREIEFELATDVYSYAGPDIEGVITFEYPTGWTASTLTKDSVWLKELTKDTDVVRYALSYTPDKTHLQTATEYAAKIGKVDTEVELVQSGETAGEKLVFAIYSFKVADKVNRLAVIDVTEAKNKDKVRVVISTTSTTETLLNLVNQVNLTK